MKAAAWPKSSCSFYVPSRLLLLMGAGLWFNGLVRIEVIQGFQGAGLGPCGNCVAVL